MDESEQKPSEDAPAAVPTTSDRAADSKLTRTAPESGKGESSSPTAGGPRASLSGQEGSSPKTGTPEASSPLPASKSSRKPAARGKGEKEEGGSETLAAQSAGSAESRERSASSQRSKEEPGDKSLAGASSGPGAVPADGVEGPGGSDVMAKMMEVMAKGSASATPRGPDDSKKALDNSMAKGGGMPDMMAMMAKGGMPDMMAMMAKGGMPDMMAMMSGGGNMPDMKAMMSKMEGGGPMGMAKLFNCIIDVSLARPDSDSSDEDEGSVAIEIPCQYCSRFFTNQMSLKTHILVAHDHQDSSVLNLKKLVLDKGKRSVKDHHGARRKQSKDCEKLVAVEAASTDSHQLEGSVPNKETSPQGDSSAAESSRGTKRGRRDRREMSGASGGEEGSYQSDLAPPRLDSGAAPSTCGPGSPPESRKRSARLRSQCSGSGDAPSQVTTKKSKSGDEGRVQEGSPAKQSAPSSGQVTRSGEEQPPRAGSPQPHRSAKETSKHKAIKADLLRQPSPVRTSPVTRGKRTSWKEKGGASSDTDIISGEAPSGGAGHSRRGKGSKGQQPGNPAVSVPAVSSAAQGSEAASASRRSLRSRKSY